MDATRDTGFISFGVKMASQLFFCFWCAGRNYVRKAMRFVKPCVLLGITIVLLQLITLSLSIAGTSDAEQNVRALNHLNMSLYKIANYNNKVVLEEEYDIINNDINLDAIGDKRLVGIIQDLMDALTALRISEKERLRLQADYERRQEDLMMDILRNGGKIIGTRLAEAADSGSGFITGGPWRAAAHVIASVPTVASSVTKPVAEMYMQKQKLEDFEWSLDVDRLKSLNDLNKKLLSTYWDFLHDSHIPDSLRISEKQIANLLDVNREKEPAKRYRMLVRLEKECGNIPSYWYYRADAAHDMIKSNKGVNADQEKKLAVDIQACLDRYRECAGMLRKDRTLASLIMLRLATADLSQEEARAAIAQMVEPFPLDASKRLFAALTSLKYGMDDDAIEHLNANLDMRQYEVISRKLLSDIYENRKDEQRAAMLIKKLISEDSTSNQELLYHLGKLRAYEQFMAGLEPQLEAIKMQVNPAIVGDDDVEILMPVKWEIVENATVPATMKLGDKEFASEKMEITKDRNIRIVFKKAVKESNLASRHPVPVTAEIQTKHFPILIEGILSFPEKQAQEGQGMMSKIKDTAKKIIPKSEGAFNLTEIRCDDISFQNINGKWVKHRRDNAN